MLLITFVSMMNLRNERQFVFDFSPFIALDREENHIREEIDYRFDIILYMHRKFQMFEFPLFPRGRSVTRPKITNKNLTKKPKVIRPLP